MTKDLLPCPFCGGEAETKMYLWGHHAETHAPIWCYYVYCVSCDAMTDNIFKSKEDAVAAWNHRHQQENRPLTLDELRGMDGEPVWIYWMDWLSSRKDCWAIVHLKNPEGTMWDLRAYGKAWLAYRRKPKEEV